MFQYGAWKEVGNLKHPDLTNLADRMKSAVPMSRATSTVNGHTRAFNMWKEFASRWGKLYPFQRLALYLQYLLESTSSCSSVHAALCGLKWVHETAALVSPTDSSLVVVVRETSKRIRFQFLLPTGVFWFFVSDSVTGYRLIG